LVLLAGVTLVAASCNQQAQTNTPSPTPSSSNSSDISNSQPPASDTTNNNSATTTLALKTGTSSTLGTYLTAANGMTLYMYTKDTPGVSNCTGTCATAWTPYTVSVPDGLVGSLGISGQIGTIARADGTMQLTYNNKPLYFWQKDKKAGDTTGQNVGGVWFVVKP
jgi:predicted lipoprotein with Yx(FWY)xxD motif